MTLPTETLCLEKVPRNKICQVVDGSTLASRVKQQVLLCCVVRTESRLDLFRGTVFLRLLTYIYGALLDY